MTYSDSSLTIFRDLVRLHGCRFWQQFVSVEAPAPGIDAAFAIAKNQFNGTRVSSVFFENVVLIVNGELCLAVGSFSDFSAVLRAGLDGKPPRKSEIERLFVSVIQEGDYSLVEPSVGRLTGSDFKVSIGIHGLIKGLRPDMSVSELQQTFRDIGCLFALLSHRAASSWCVAVEPHCDLEALSLMKECLPIFAPRLARRVDSVDRGEVLVNAWSLTGGYSDEVSLPYGLKPDIGHVPRHLLQPEMLEYLPRFVELKALGRNAVRALEDLGSTWNWLVHMPFVDRPFFNALLNGHPLAPIVERRLGISRRTRRSWEICLKAMREMSKDEREAMWVGSDLHPVIATKVRNLSNGHAWNELAWMMDVMPANLLPSSPKDENFKRLPLRAALLWHILNRNWTSIYFPVDTPKNICLHHGRRDRDGERDWRLRLPIYARKNLKSLISNGGIPLADHTAERVEEILGWCEDVHNARKWSMVQLIGAEVARILHERWVECGSPIDFDDPENDFGEELAEVMVSWGAYSSGPCGHPFFVSVAEQMCSDKDAGLAAAFSHLTLPRSVKKLRKTTDLFHRLRGVRGDHPVRGESERLSSWASLFEGGEIHLNDFPDVYGLCLTSPRMLNDEGLAMEHCVGGYYRRCESGTDHILSIRSVDGERLSTVHIGKRPTGYGDDFGYRFGVIEHRGHGNKPATPQASEFVNELSRLIDAPQFGGLPVTPEASAARPSVGSKVNIEHDPWAEDASDREMEVLKIFSGRSFDLNDIKLLARRVVDRSHCWTCPWPHRD